MSSQSITIDGSAGEGGGQVLRTSLALSMLTGKPIEIVNIRSRRRNPGLQAQHVESVRAAQRVTAADLQGDHIGSGYIRFSPGKVKGGKHEIRIGTAGSTSLVLHTIYLPLSFAEEDSDILITGGTHVPWSPTFDFLKNCWLYFADLLGLKIDLTLNRAGLYPQGGGEIHVRVSHVPRLLPVNITERGNLEKIRIYSAHTNLTDEVAQRQARQSVKLVGHLCSTETEVTELPSLSRSTAFSVTGIFRNTRCCYTSLGERGKRAEVVAEEACNQFFEFMKTGATIDEYMADQIVLPLSFATGMSVLLVSKVTNHLLTNIATIQKFVDVDINLIGKLGETGKMIIQRKV
jgi:RNA 3'-terminal phosphate cyclase (ATP)